MNRTRVWEADCALLDVVLALSFDTQELLNACQTGRLAPSTCEHGYRHAAINAIHRACHHDSPFARLMERRLDLIHAQALRDVDEQGVLEASESLLHLQHCSAATFAGKLWALTTSAEPCAAHLRACLRSRLTLLGAEALARETVA